MQKATSLWPFNQMSSKYLQNCDFCIEHRFNVAWQPASQQRIDIVRLTQRVILVRTVYGDVGIKYLISVFEIRNKSSSFEWKGAYYRQVVQNRSQQISCYFKPFRSWNWKERKKFVKVNDIFIWSDKCMPFIYFLMIISFKCCLRLRRRWSMREL